MLFLIDMHRTWVVVDDGHLYEERFIFKRGKFRKCVSRILVLRSMYKKGAYKRGTKWCITEYELDKALAYYRKQNSQFKRRIMKGGSYLQADDVNAIVEIATCGIIRLELTDLPLYKQY